LDAKKKTADPLPFGAGEWQGRSVDDGGGKLPPSSSMRVKPGSGLYYSDDDAKMDEVFDDQYRAKYFSNIPSEDYRVRGRNRVKGGPDLPPNATDEQKAIRKAFTDKTRRLNYAKMKAANTKASPLKNPTIDCDVYSGDQCAHIRLMEIVEKHPLEVGHTFEQKETMMIRIAEEANLRNIKTSIARSCTLRYVVAGENFYVSASNTAQGIIPNKLLFIPEKKMRCPFEAEWIGHLLKGHLETSPGLSYALLRGYLIHHVRLDLVTENILQNARVWATNELFGNPENNVGYAEGVRDAIREMGHSCELTYGTRREVIVKLRTTVIREEIQRRESNKEPVLEKGTMTDSFIRKWLIDNEVELTKQLGMEDGPPQKFLTGMFLCTSVSKVQVRYLQDVIQADGAHMSFGKYTLFSAYATTANGTMAPLGFAILFGNEDLANWTLFWKFILAEHPIINQVHKTVITDQDKGALASIQEVLPKVGHFHCSFHRRQNIKKKFGGGEGNTPLTCLWMFNLLVNQSKPANINHFRNMYYPQMRPAHTAYLETLRDEQQYPGARCNATIDDSDADHEAPDIFLYGLTASSGVESMNSANKDLRKRSAVDILNAGMILLKKEGIRFNRTVQDAHKASRFSNSKLTPRGIQIMDEIFKRCDHSEYRIQRTEHPDFHKFVVSKRAVGSREYFVTIPKVGQVHGSRFGSCTCGSHKKEGCPCNHMVAVVKSGAIPLMTNVELMPYWYTRDQWQLQFPKDVVFRFDCTWKKIKEESNFDENVHHCPAWAAGGKKGRPKKNARKLGIADHIELAAKKRKASTRRSNNTRSGRNNGGNRGGHAQTAMIGERGDTLTAIIGELDIPLEDTKDGVGGDVGSV